MANVDRSRIEVLRRRVYPTTSTDVILMGDNCVVDASGNARPAAINTGGSAAAARDAVADAYAGVAIHAKLAAETPNIVVAVDAVVEMDCSGLAAVGKVGDPFEIDTTDDGATWTPTSQKVTPGATNPIGKLAYAEPVGATTVRIHIVGKAVSAPVTAD